MNAKISIERPRHPSLPTTSGRRFESGHKLQKNPFVLADKGVLSLSKFLFDKLSKHFQNFHKSSENAVIENERHP